MSWQRMCYYKYNRAIISITELHYMLVPWRAGREWELFLEVTLSQCLRWVIPECFILLGDSKAGLQASHATVNRGLWLLVSDHNHDIDSCTWLQCIQSASQKSGLQQAMHQCTGVDDSPLSWAQAWNCKIAPGCKLHLVLLTQIYYWALLFCK